MASKHVFHRLYPFLNHSKYCLGSQQYQLTSRRFKWLERSQKIKPWDEYQELKHHVEAQRLPKDQDPAYIFTNNELNLDEIEVYGFDYDYTLASYTPHLHPLIYHLAKQVLVDNLKYPKEIAKIEFDPDFAVLGLHCDIQKGLLLKIDAFHDIQLGAVYKGLQPLSDKDVTDLYQGTHVSIEEMSNFYGTLSHGAIMTQLMDMFALPEMTLYANVIEYLNMNEIPYSPEYVFYDVQNAVQGLHQSGKLHETIMNNHDLYLGLKSSHREVKELLIRLTSAGKKLFLISNSNYDFINAGMSYIVGTDWQNLFDVVIAHARKPKFFNESTRPMGKYRIVTKQRPFRLYDVETRQKSWSTVDTLEKGKIYTEGNYYDLRNMTGYFGGKVLYFGDHVYTDLADVTLKHGWRTGAIIPELEHEINGLNSIEFKEAVRWKLALESLIERRHNNDDDPESLEALNQWIEERENLRVSTKVIFNKQFGSIFRTYSNPTYFTRRLNRFADIYTSSVVNLLNYSTRHTFYPRRSSLPHERKIGEYINSNGYESE